MASSKVFEHSRPIERENRRAIFPALRAAITGGAEAWHPMPTSAMRSAPWAIASGYAIGLAE